MPIQTQPFQPEISGEHQCPDCWEQSRTQSDMYAIGNDEPEKGDLFRCRREREHVYFVPTPSPFALGHR